MKPIYEAKFHKQSYILDQTDYLIIYMQLINISKLHYIVDMDIKTFFDNVNHVKLKKQMWYMGIKNKNLI